MPNATATVCLIAVGLIAAGSAYAATPQKIAALARQERSASRQCDSAKTGHISEAACRRPDALHRQLMVSGWCLGDDSAPESELHWMRVGAMCHNPPPANGTGLSAARSAKFIQKPAPTIGKHKTSSCTVAMSFPCEPGSTRYSPFTRGSSHILALGKGERSPT
jgi:hypothetical protein